jgi:hypothetical protein
VAKPVMCLLLVLFENGTGVAFLNWLTWFVTQPARITAWFGAWFAPLVETFGQWLLWFAGPVGALGFLILRIISNSQIALDWSATVAGWIWGAMQELFNYLVSLIIYWMIFIHNWFTENVVGLIVAIWNTYAAGGLSSVWGFVLFVLDQLGIVGNLILGLFFIFWTLAQLIWSFISAVATLPLTFYYAFSDSVNGSTYVFMPTCNNDVAETWCKVLYGIQVIDVGISHSILYPLTIIGIIIATITIFWKNVWELLRIDYK